MELLRGICEPDLSPCEVDEFLAQGVGTIGFDRELKKDALFCIAFVDFDQFLLCDDAVNGVSVGESDAEAYHSSGDDFFFLGGSQAFGDGVSVSAHEAADAEFDAAEISRDMGKDGVEGLSVDGGEDWPSGAGTWLAVVAKAICVAETPCPAVVGGIVGA